jgi:hypothetical protein
MKSHLGGESSEESTDRLRYLEYLSKLLTETYALLKEIKIIPQGRKSFIEGVMSAGQFLGVNKNDLEKLIEKVNYEVFGMSIQERRKVFKEIPLSEDKLYDIPAYIRKGKRLSI